MISALSAVAYGGYSYFQNLLPVLAEVDPVNRYSVLLKPRHLEELRVRADNMVFIPVAVANTSAAMRTMWEQLVLPGRLKQWHANAVYTANNVGLLRCDVPVVIAIRNLEPFFFSQYADGSGLRLRNRALRWLTLRSVQSAKRVIVVSEFTRDVVSGECPGDLHKMRLIYHGHPRIVPDDEAASRFRKRHGLNGEYFLANSKFVPYSNLHKLIEGYGAAVRLTPDLPKLVVAGGDASSSYKRMVLETIRTNGLSDKVLLAGLIPHTANLALMRSAKLFLFASLLEACPNTLIEALTEGCVILSSNRPPMREVAGDAAVYFDPLDPANIATRIVEASRMSGQEITSIRAAAIQRSRQFTWLESATRLRKVLEEAATQASARG